MLFLYKDLEPDPNFQCFKADLFGRNIINTETLGGLSQYFIFGIHRVLKRVARSNELLDSITVDQSHFTSTLFLTNTQTAGI